jgi:hypothetical protein
MLGIVNAPDRWWVFMRPNVGIKGRPIAQRLGVALNDPLGAVVLVRVSGNDLPPSLP